MLNKCIHLLAVFSFILMGTQFVHAHEISSEAAHVHISGDLSVSDHGHGHMNMAFSEEETYGSEVHCGAHLLMFTNAPWGQFMRVAGDYVPGTSYHEKIFMGAFELPPPRA